MSYEEFLFLTKLADVIEDLDDGKIVEIHNEMCEDYNYPDDRIEYNDADELFAGLSPYEILSHINTDYNVTDDYSKIDGYGNWSSSDYVDDFVDFDELAEYIYKEEKFFDVDEIEELYNEYMEEDEDEEDEEE